MYPRLIYISDCFRSYILYFLQIPDHHFLRILLFVCDALSFLIYPIDFRALETAVMEQPNTSAISLSKRRGAP